MNMNTYFHFTDEKAKDKRVIVFKNGAKTGGQSYWHNGKINYMNWTYSEMKKLGAKRITREKALRICKFVP